MRTPYYILDNDGNPQPCDDVLTYASWREVEDALDSRRVARTDVGDDCYVSTVFLGIDQRFGEGPPVLWETMIFGGPHGDYQERYTSRSDAEAGHERAVAMARGPHRPEQT